MNDPVGARHRWGDAHASWPAARGAAGDLATDGRATRPALSDAHCECFSPASAHPGRSEHRPPAAIPNGEERRDHPQSRERPQLRNHCEKARDEGDTSVRALLLLRRACGAIDLRPSLVDRATRRVSHVLTSWWHWATSTQQRVCSAVCRGCASSQRPQHHGARSGVRAEMARPRSRRRAVPLVQRPRALRRPPG